MSGRALLAIGCDKYDHLSPLNGAECDASCIFELLAQTNIGDYDHSRSSLLKSPTLQEARATLTAMLFGDESLDTLTIAFAGHGAVSGGSFYMAMRDSHPKALSATALSLAELLRMIADASPRQTYLVIDACQSGGLISDLNVIVKSELMGKLGTPGVTLLAMSASNEDAIEIDGNGVGTSALLECIRGNIFLQDSNPALDLVEIGRVVSARVSAAGAQTPVVWGLNLSGPAGFCKNPHSGTGNAPLRSVLVGWPDATTSEVVRNGLPHLWESYVGISSRWEPRAFLDKLSPLLCELKDDPEVLIHFARRVTDAYAMRAFESRDRFHEVQVRAACAVALLPFSNAGKVADFLASSCLEIAALVEHAVSQAIAAIDEYQFALVTGGMGDLYYLPLRISQLLGWAGFAVHARLAIGGEVEPARQCLADLFSRIFDTYSLSLVAMSDAQAPHILSVLTASSLVDLSDEAERLIGHLFSSCVQCAGRVARSDLDPSKVFSYLMARGNLTALDTNELVAQPTELALMLLRASQLFDLTDEFDSALSQLDHLALNAYLPDDYRDFGAEHISGGTNAVFQIGQDIWNVAEIDAAWPNNPLPSNPGMAMTALLASLIFTDRTAWYLLSSPLLIEG
jgi:Caspase domain